MRKSWHEYTAVKDEHLEEIVLFDEGEYTIALCDDAKLLAATCNLVITGRDFPEVGRVPLCGFPTKDREHHVKELLFDGWGVHMEGGSDT